MSQKAKLLTIHCIDLRFQQMINEDILKRAKFGEFDRIAWPGATIDFENVKNAAINVSIKLHSPDEIIIYEHEDCGAYGENNDFEVHKVNAKKLADTITSENPNLKVTTLIATFSGVKNL